mgnify:CR=1 FL=1
MIFNYSVSDTLTKLNSFNDLYCKYSQIPKIDSYFDLCLFNTFRSYINISSFFPRSHKEHNDDRGSFSELSRVFSQGQTSFSITKKGVIRGNHFHTRKIERFSVIRGKAKIELREILSDKKFEFILDGAKPSYIDIPVWHIHNIQNFGDEDLITVFWINEHYDSWSPNEPQESWRPDLAGTTDYSQWTEDNPVNIHYNSQGEPVEMYGWEGGIADISMLDYGIDVPGGMGLTPNANRTVFNSPYPGDLNEATIVREEVDNRSDWQKWKDSLKQGWEAK